MLGEFCLTEWQISLVIRILKMAGFTLINAYIFQPLKIWRMFRVLQYVANATDWLISRIQSAAFCPSPSKTFVENVSSSYKDLIGHISIGSLRGSIQMWNKNNSRNVFFSLNLIVSGHWIYLSIAETVATKFLYKHKKFRGFVWSLGGLSWSLGGLPWSLGGLPRSLGGCNLNAQSTLKLSHNISLL